MRFLLVILSFIPVFSFAEVQITKHKIELSHKSIKKSEIFTLNVVISGTVKPFSHEQLSVMYPKKLSTKEIEIVNVSISHSTKQINDSNKFNINLKFYFRANRIGYLEIPNLPIAFMNTSPFFTTPKQDIQIVETYYPFLIYYIIGFFIVFITFLIYLWIKYKPPYKALNLLEITTYHKFNKLKDKNNIQINLRQLLIRYLRKKFNKKSHLIHEWELGNFNNLTENKLIQQKLQQFWQKCSDSNWDNNTLKTQEEQFKSFLYLFQELKETDGINES